MRKLFSCFALMAAISAHGASISATLTTQDVYQIALRETKQIFRDDREDTFVNDASLQEAIVSFLGIPGELRVDANYLIFDGCRPHSCPEKSVVVVDARSQRLLAAGLLHFNCRLMVYEGKALQSAVTAGTAAPRNTCDEEATLAIFVIRGGTTFKELVREGELVETIRKWGKEAGYARETLKVKVRAKAAR